MDAISLKHWSTHKGRIGARELITVGCDSNICGDHLPHQVSVTFSSPMLCVEQIRMIRLTRLVPGVYSWRLPELFQQRRQPTLPFATTHHTSIARGYHHPMSDTIANERIPWPRKPSGARIPVSAMTVRAHLAGLEPNARRAINVSSNHQYIPGFNKLTGYLGAMSDVRIESRPRG